MSGQHPGDPSGTPEQNARYRQSFYSELSNNTVWIFNFILGLCVSTLGLAFLGVPLEIAAIVGAILGGAFAVFVDFRMKKRAQKRHTQIARSKAAQQEQEFQKQLLEAKRSGSFERFKKSDK